MDKIRCPLVNNENIDIADCIENVDIVDGMIKEDGMPERFKKNENWRKICESCKYHDM